MAGVELAEWSYMVSMLNRMLVMRSDEEGITRIVKHSLLPVLETAEILLSRHRNNPLLVKSLS